MAPYVGEQMSDFRLQGGGGQYIKIFWNSYFTTTDPPPPSPPTPTYGIGSYLSYVLFMCLIICLIEEKKYIPY